MNIFLHKTGEIRLVWRLLLFVTLLLVLASPLLLLSSNLMQFLLGAILLTGLLIFWSRHIDRKRLRYYGLEASRRMGMELVTGMIIGCTAVAAMFLLVALPTTPDRWSFHGHAINMAFGLFFLKTVLVAYWEETMFRGFLLVNLRTSFSSRWGNTKGTIAAVTASSLLFGAIHSGTDHFSWLAFAILTLNGIIWCVPMMMTGRLGLSIGLHASWNFAQSKIFGFAMSGNASQGALLHAQLASGDLWTGGAYGPEGGILGVAGLLIMFGLVIAYCCWVGKLGRLSTIMPGRHLGQSGREN